MVGDLGKKKNNTIQDIWVKINKYGIFRSDKLKYEVGKLVIFTTGVDGIWDEGHSYIFTPPPPPHP